MLDVLLNVASFAGGALIAVLIARKDSQQLRSVAEYLRRETQEEAGIRCGRVSYFASQPWPFPTSLMLGFHADRIGGELRIDPVELADARGTRAMRAAFAAPEASIP